MAITYSPIATTTANGSSNSVTFSSISGSYTDLVLVVNNANTTAADYDGVALRFNSDTGTNYSRTYMYGDGTSTASVRQTNGTNLIVGISSPNNVIRTNTIVYIQNYSNTTTYKSTLSRSNDANLVTYAIVGMWRNTAAITSVTVVSNGSGNWSNGSTFTLYGIASA